MSASDYIIAYRVGRDGRIEFVKDEDGAPSVFPSMSSADSYAATNRLFASGRAEYQVLEIEI